MKVYLCLICALFFLTQCRKFDDNSASFDIIEASTQAIEKVVFLNDTLGYACGGDRRASGFIIKTTDGGQSWESQTIFYPDKKVYEVYFLDENVGFAGSEDNFIYKTNDGGANWSLEWLIPMSFHEVHRPIARQFLFLDNNNGYFVGGEDYQVGTIYKTTDQGTTWEFDTLIHEIRGISFNGPDKGVLSGYGYIATLGSNGVEHSQIDHPDGFFTAIHMFSNTEMITIDQNGGIYRTTDGGKKWKKILRKNRFIGKRYFFSDMAFNGNTGVISGNDGLLLISKDRGVTWTQVSNTPQTKLNRISFYGQFAFIGTDNGSILKLAV